ncbi:inorganic phosphate transporter Pho88 [Gigaspora rosea]|uniref:Inorganic phosphate transporter Pho88 n=1 Tax=Gigaspora rosea TaxID=44941 RepID=A0A397TXG2_9GLOM|nr:inorganic phosphate transporter Pho88 [Gigaspora rosea]CAG8579572.1 16233_t:CDS:2 [Gigaspora rosea]
MNAQVLNLVIILFVVQVARKLDLENPENIIYVRSGYIGVQTLILSICYYLATIIKKKNDTTALEYVEPAKRLTDEPSKHVETTNRDYDLGKLQELLKQTVIGIGFMMVLHLWFEFTQPLFIQSLLPLKITYENPLVQIHLLGKPAEGDLKRPFKTAGLFGNLVDSQQPQTDKTSIKKAKKASNSGQRD